jgi:endonuclease/exonuclease/phosphatase (EEP) superfamily protein YafD
MHFYSRFEMSNTLVRRIIDEEIPSIRTELTLSGGVKIELHALHPKPPSPTESPDSVDRDGELLIVGREVAENTKPVIVAGDLNDVAWSKSTFLFRKISRLLDPRIGRGAFSTYHAGYPLFRWPLDHIFHSDHFTLVEIKRLRNVGSDHYPIFIKLAYTPKKMAEQEAPEADEADEKLADERILNALVKG